MTKEKNWPYLTLGLGAFVAFLMELVIAMIEMAAYGGFSADVFTLSFPQTLTHWALTYITWGLFAFVIHKIAQKKLGFNLFALKGNIKPVGLLIILSMCSVHIVYNTFTYNPEVFQLKPISEYNAFIRMFGDQGWIAALFQLVYYCFEGLVMMVIVAFGQEFGERQFKKKNIPWGGILLALTWGLFHWVTKFSLEAAISCSVVAIYFGVCYLLLKKNAIYSWLLFFVVYML